MGLSELAAIFRQRQSQRDKSSGGGDRVSGWQREGSGAALMDGKDSILFFLGGGKLRCRGGQVLKTLVNLNWRSLISLHKSQVKV